MGQKLLNSVSKTLTSKKGLLPTVSKTANKLVPTLKKTVGSLVGKKRRRRATSKTGSVDQPSLLGSLLPATNVDADVIIKSLNLKGLKLKLKAKIKK